MLNVTLTASNFPCVTEHQSCLKAARRRCGGAAHPLTERVYVNVWPPWSCDALRSWTRWNEDVNGLASQEVRNNIPVEQEAGHGAPL